MSIQNNLGEIASNRRIQWKSRARTCANAAFALSSLTVKNISLNLLPATIQSAQSV